MENLEIKKAFEAARKHVDELKHEVQKENTELQQKETRKVELQRLIDEKKKEMTTLETELRKVERTDIPHLQDEKRKHAQDLQKFEQEFQQLSRQK